MNRYSLWAIVYCLNRIQRYGFRCMYYNFHWVLLSTRVMGFLFPFLFFFSLEILSTKYVSGRFGIFAQVSRQFYTQCLSLACDVFFFCVRHALLAYIVLQSFTAYHFVIQAITMSTRQLASVDSHFIINDDTTNRHVSRAKGKRSKKNSKRKRKIEAILFLGLSCKRHKIVPKTFSEKM